MPSGVLERGLLLRLRFELDHHVNLRPVRLLPGVATPLAGVKPGDIDLVVVREGTEGPYAGAGGVLRHGTPHEVATEESLNTAYGVERVVRDAFARAQAPAAPAAHPGAQEQRADARRRPVDAHGRRRSRRSSPTCAPTTCTSTRRRCSSSPSPQRFDVIVTDNLFGDILTDLGAAIAGGIGLAASGNLDVSRANPSMFEPVHGSAPDIAGQGKADPTATVLSVAMLLDHLGLPEAAARGRRGGRRRPGRPGRRPSLAAPREVGDALAARAAG